MVVSQFFYHSNFLKKEKKRKEKKVVGLLFHGGALLFGNLISTACWYKKLLPVLNKGLNKGANKKGKKSFLFIYFDNQYYSQTYCLIIKIMFF
jgi:CRISPR/Cas system-associated endonuclease/helicase Cas3